MKTTWENKRIISIFSYLTAILAITIFIAVASFENGKEKTTNTAAVSWTHCADQGITCSFTGKRKVRYGASGAYFSLIKDGSIECTDEVFGDPLPMVDKSCDYSDPIALAPLIHAPHPISVLPTPINIKNGSTVNLQCGKTYQGTLELNGTSNIVVKTEGKCGKANITPGRSVVNWIQYRGNIYSAQISFIPMQVAIDGNTVSKAHWPNYPKVWTTGTDSIPSKDLSGATLVYRENEYSIGTKPLTSKNTSISKPFYVEGKLWMLDSPGEWAVKNGRLYMWTLDWKSPEGRVWAAPDSNGINADNSANITVDGVGIFSATDGISGDTSINLKVLNSDIINSARDGIWASGSQGILVNHTTISNARRNGIDGWYSTEGAIITNSTVTGNGMVGMPSPSDAGIMFGNGSNNRIDHVRVTSSSYIGIDVLHSRNTSVTNSVVDSACMRLTDCGAIYTNARDKLPLNLRIEGNTFKNTEGFGIYLDDFANGVIVRNNSISKNTQGMFIHNGFDNVIEHNIFDSNDVAHLGFGQDSGIIRNNKITANIFKSSNDVLVYKLETGSNLKTFASYDYNTYMSTNPGLFGRTWDENSSGINASYAEWKNWTKQDTHSTMNGKP